jgi:ABC-type iron transport system FetAB ATPase subunit
MNKPQVLLLDEATASLDRKNTDAVEQIVKQYQQDTGAAIIWVSHDDSQVDRVGSRHYFLTPTQLKEVA